MVDKRIQLVGIFLEQRDQLLGDDGLLLVRQIQAINVYVYISVVYKQGSLLRVRSLGRRTGGVDLIPVVSFDNVVGVFKKVSSLRNGRL